MELLLQNISEPINIDELEEKMLQLLHKLS